MGVEKLGSIKISSYEQNKFHWFHKKLSNKIVVEPTVSLNLTTRHVYSYEIFLSLFDF